MFSGGQMKIDRRTFLLAGVATLAARPILAQTDHSHHGELFERLTKPGRIGLPELATTQHVFDSLAPKAATPGRWMTRTALPLPRSEMAWAVAHAARCTWSADMGSSGSIGLIITSTIQ
jgi:hypothetical protein